MAGAEPTDVLRRACNLAGFPQLSVLPEEVLTDLQSSCRVRKFTAGEIIHHAQEDSGFVGFVRDGILRMQKNMLDGRQHIVGLLVEGDMFGRVFDSPDDFAIEAATDCEILTFPRRPFEALLARSPELDRVVMLNFLNELDRARDWMIILAHSKIRGRLAGFLLMIVSRFTEVDHLLETKNGEIRVRIPISRTDLADLLGTRPESISRAFHALADDGVFRIERPDLVALTSLDPLAAESGELDFDDIGSVLEIVRGARRAAV